MYILTSFSHLIFHPNCILQSRIELKPTKINRNPTLNKRCLALEIGMRILYICNAVWFGIRNVHEPFSRLVHCLIVG